MQKRTKTRLTAINQFDIITVAKESMCKGTPTLAEMTVSQGLFFYKKTLWE